MIQVIDDYLKPEEHELIKSYVMGENDRGNIKDSFLWQWQVESCDGHPQFCHLLYSNYLVHSQYFEMVRPILNKEEMVSIAKIKANLLTRTEDVVVYDKCFHQDFSPESSKIMITGIYYVNSNNGYTLFEDGTKVESLANRFVVFPCHIKHGGMPFTDDSKRRIVINFNWF
jgi:hypothetical protein